MQNDQLREHVYATYVMLRWGLTLVALALPLLLAIVGWLNDIPLQGSMSAYYHAVAPGAHAVMRDPFVGALFVIGAGLIIYRGFSTKENWLLNLAGICAIFVALVPMNRVDVALACESTCLPAGATMLHSVFAFALFVCIAAVSLTCYKATLGQLPTEKLRRHFARRYQLITGLMIVLPLLTYGIARLAAARPGVPDWSVFLVETVAIWVFAFYWYTKSRELAKSSAEMSALRY